MMLILMLIMMLKFCVKESSNMIGLKNFAAAVFLNPWFFKSQISPNPPPFSTKFLLYYYLKVEIKE